MIEIRKLSRSFGNIKAVDEISFKINPGEIVGFLGPNGAGKTTTMRMIVGYLQPSGGLITINDKNIFDDPIETARQIGYLPEHNPLYDEMIVYDYLQYVANLRMMTPVEFSQRLSYVIQKCGLSSVMAQTTGTLSKGYRQRVGLAQAIIHDPSILILDEPTSGLDPNQILEIRDLIRELGEHKTVILSSHIMQEVQALCDRVIIINRGIIIADDTKERLSTISSNRVQIVVEVESEDPDLTELLELYPEISLVSRALENSVSTLVFEAAADYDLKREIAKYMNKYNILILGMYHNRQSLEEVFHILTKEAERENEGNDLDLALDGLIETTDETEPNDLDIEPSPNGETK